MVADHYRTEHHEFVVRPEAASVAPTLAWHYGEPYADSSAVPTYYLSRLARQHITVALTGDGGDESFVGYRRYLAHLAARWYRKVPGALRVPLERAVAVLPAASLSHSRLYDAQRFINAASDSDHHRYASWFGFFSELEAGHGGLRELQAAFESHRARHPIDAAMATDVSLYLPDDLLVKIDIAAMAHGLETRSPLLDHKVMELAARLPVNVKLRGLRPKSLLRALGSSLVPPAVLSRPKTGFGVPLDQWFRDDLVEPANDILLTSTAQTHEHVSRGGDRQPAGRSSRWSGGARPPAVGAAHARVLVSGVPRSADEGRLGPLVACILASARHETTAESFEEGAALECTWPVMVPLVALTAPTREHEEGRRVHEGSAHWRGRFYRFAPGGSVAQCGPWRQRRGRSLDGIHRQHPSPEESARIRVTPSTQ